MPSQAFASPSRSRPAPQAPGPAGPGFRGMLGNAELVQRLLGGSSARAEARGALPKWRDSFPSLVTAGPDEAPAEDLAAATDTTLLADAGVVPEAGETTTGPAVAGPAAGPTTDTTGTGTSPGPRVDKVTPKEGTETARIYHKHEGQVNGRTAKMTPAQAEDLDLFVANWKKNQKRYEAVAQKTGVPAPLIAALHWRESTGDFTTYLHQGDKLGRKARHVPRNIPVFSVWEDAAVHALTMSDKAAVRDDLGMKADTRDAAAMATYAEFYNGLGYDMRKTSSPYVYSGTDNYSRGKYVSDGRYSKTYKDQQLGVLAMVDAVNGSDSPIKDSPARGPKGWDSVVAGRTLKRGASGPLVKELQSRLAEAGFPCGDDGRFGPTVERTVKAFQKAAGLPDDGIVGTDVAKKLQDPKSAVQPAGPTTPAPGPSGPAPEPAPRAAA